MLIAGAEIDGGGIRDVRVEHGRIAAIGRQLAPVPGEASIDARGGLLLPGLHDHHIHVAALAASLSSVACGPPGIVDADAFAAALRVPGEGWLRAVGYHESVAGLLDARALDRIVPDRPLRVQHRSGRMWFLNSAALDTLLAGRAPPAGLERIDGRYTGRLFDADAWLRQALGSRPPCFATVGAMLARSGVTGLTDMSPANDGRMARHFAEQRAGGALPQRILLAGSASLSDAAMPADIQLGPTKLHLHEADLPEYDEAVALARGAHRRDRAVAVHCATEVELVFALAVIAAAGAAPGDRIEHASVAPDTAIGEIARLELAVVSQPHFIAERGDVYRRTVEAELQPLLYRLRAFGRAGVPLAAGSDAPFGHADPWAAMAAAVSRRTRDGATIGGGEALTPEAALDLYLRVPDALERKRTLAIGAAADLCLLDRPWARAREALDAVRVRGTWVAGRPIFDRIDQAPR